MSDVWHECFALGADGRIHGLNAVGRATAWLLQMNSPERIEMRQLLIQANRW